MTEQKLSKIGSRSTTERFWFTIPSIFLQTFYDALTWNFYQSISHIRKEQAPIELAVAIKEHRA
jgi:hypothetical protein